MSSNICRSIPINNASNRSKTIIVCRIYLLLIRMKSKTIITNGSISISILIICSLVNINKSRKILKIKYKQWRTHHDAHSISFIQFKNCAYCLLMRSISILRATDVSSGSTTCINGRKMERKRVEMTKCIADTRIYSNNNAHTVYTVQFVSISDQMLKKSKDKWTKWSERKIHNLNSLKRIWTIIWERKMPYYQNNSEGNITMNNKQRTNSCSFFQCNALLCSSH